MKLLLVIGSPVLILYSFGVELIEKLIETVTSAKLVLDLIGERGPELLEKTGFPLPSSLRSHISWFGGVGRE